MEDMDAAARAASIEDNGVGATGFFIGRNFPVDKGVVSNGLRGGARRHHVEDEGDENERDRDHKQSPSKPVDLIGERLLATGTLQHFAGLELRCVLISGVRRRGVVAGGLTVEKLGGGGRSVSDLTVGGGSGGRSLQLLGIL